YLDEKELQRILTNQQLIRNAPNTITDKMVFLENLKIIKGQGYAVDDEEVTEGARCIAAPIFSLTGTVEAAVSISGAIHRYPSEKIPSIANDVMLAAQKISEKWGYI